MPYYDPFDIHPIFVSAPHHTPISHSHPGISPPSFRPIKLDEFACSRSPPVSHHPALQFDKRVDAVHARLTGSDSSGHSQILWDAEFKLNGGTRLSHSIAPVGGMKPLFPSKILCGKEDLKLSVQAEQLKPYESHAYWPPYPKNGPILHKQRPLGNPMQFRGCGALNPSQDCPQNSSGVTKSIPHMEPNSNICTKIVDLQKIENDKNVGEAIPLPRPAPGEQVLLDQGTADMLNKESYALSNYLINSQVSVKTQGFFASNDSATAFPRLLRPNTESLPSTVSTPDYRHMESIRVAQVADGSIGRSFSDEGGSVRFDPMACAEDKTAEGSACFRALSKIDRLGALSFYRQVTRSPGLTPLQRSHFRFWFGAHDRAPLHPTILFSHPAHYANIKLLDDKNNLLYDADFEVSGHVIAADQKAISGSAKLFPQLKAPQFGKEAGYKIIVEADRPDYAPPYVGGPDLNKKRASVSIKEPIFNPPPTVSRYGGQYPSEPVTHNTIMKENRPFTDRLSDDSRKAEFVFGIKKPLLQGEYVLNTNGSLLSFL